MSCPRPLVLLVALAATAGFAVEKPRVIVLNVAASEPGLSARAQSVAEQVLTELGETKRIDAIGSSDMAALLGLERQKQLLGCGESSTSCLAEMSSAMGAPWVVLGNLARAGKSMRVDLKLMRTSDGKALWRGGKNFKDESEMFEVVTTLTRQMIKELNPPTLEELAVKPAPVVVEQKPVAASPEPVAPAPTPTVVAPASAPVRVAPIVVSGVGLVALAVGGGLAISTKVQNQPFTSPTYSWDGALTVDQVAARQAVANRTLAIEVGVASVGAAALVTGLLWWALGKPAEAPVTVGLSVQSSTLTVGGRF